MKTNNASRISRRGFSKAFVLLAVSPALLASEHPDLSGQWKLNREQSDDPQQKMQEAFSARRGGEGQGQRQGRRRGGSGGRGGGEGRRGGMGPMMGPAETLHVEQADPEVRIEMENGRSLALYADGRSDEREGPRGNTIKTESRWDGEQLVSVREMGRGMKVTTTYRVSAEGNQLFVTTQMESQRFEEPVVIRYVYDAASDSSGAPDKGSHRTFPRKISIPV